MKTMTRTMGENWEENDKQNDTTRLGANNDFAATPIPSIEEGGVGVGRELKTMRLVRTDSP